jgi:hypothetical protein
VFFCPSCAHSFFPFSSFCKHAATANMQYGMQHQLSAGFSLVAAEAKDEKAQAL